MALEIFHNDNNYLQRLCTAICTINVVTSERIVSSVCPLFLSKDTDFTYDRIFTICLWIQWKGIFLPVFEVFGDFAKNNSSSCQQPRWGGRFRRDARSDNSWKKFKFHRLVTSHVWRPGAVKTTAEWRYQCFTKAIAYNFLWLQWNVEYYLHLHLVDNFAYNCRLIILYILGFKIRMFHSCYMYYGYMDQIGGEMELHLLIITYQLFLFVHCETFFVISVISRTRY